MRNRAAAARASLLAWILRAELVPAPARGMAAALVRRADRSLSRLSDARLGELAASSQPAERALVGGLPLEAVSASQVLAAASSEALVGPLALLFGRVPARPGERSAVLHQAIVLDTASYPLRQHCALLCVRRHAEEITSAHARGILRRCLNLAEHPVDPYAPSTLAMTARTAAAALLADDPLLDPEILRRLRSSPRARELALVQAAALQGRRRVYGSGVAAALEALRPQERQALGFARDCDRNYSALESAAPAAGRLEGAAARARGLALRAGRGAVVLGRGLAILALPVAGALAALAVDAWIVDLPSDVTVSGGAALAALGILVAVHVLSAELAADRLAGPIARVTSFPLPLKAGYAAALALVFRSLLRPADAELATYSAAVVGLTGALLVLVLWALLTLLRRTDPVRAVDAFARRRAVAVRRAGRALGGVHRQALANRELVAGYPFVKSALTAPLGEQRVPVETGRSGYLLVHAGRFRRLAMQDVWAEERVRLVLVKPFGLEISRGDEVMSIVPAEQTSLEHRELRRVRGLVRVRRGRPIDEVGEYMGILLSVAATQATAGNQGGAARIRDTALRLLDLHLSAMRASRSVAKERDDVIGMVGALRTSAVQTLRLLSEHPDANTREVLTGFLQRLLDLTDRADGFAVTLASQLGLAGQRSADSLISQLLWDCAVQALRVDDELGMREVREQVARLVGSDEGVDLGGRIVQLAAITRPRSAEHLWEWHRERSASEQVFPLTAMRIGASALRVGNASLALAVALALRSHDPATWRAYFNDDVIAGSEAAHDLLYGTLLGADAQFALLEFLGFFERSAPAVMP